MEVQLRRLVRLILEDQKEMALLTKTTKEQFPTIQHLRTVELRFQAYQLRIWLIQLGIPQDCLQMSSLRTNLASRQSKLQTHLVETTFKQAALNNKINENI